MHAVVSRTICDEVPKQRSDFLKLNDFIEQKANQHFCFPLNLLICTIR